MQPPPAAQAPGPALRGVRAVLARLRTGGDRDAEGHRPVSPPPRAGGCSTAGEGRCCRGDAVRPALRAPVACAWGAHAARGCARGAGPNGRHFSHEGSRPLLWPAAPGGCGREPRRARGDRAGRGGRGRLGPGRADGPEAGTAGAPRHPGPAAGAAVTCSRTRSLGLPADGDREGLRRAGARTDDLRPQAAGLEDVEEGVAGGYGPCMQRSGT